MTSILNTIATAKRPYGDFTYLVDLCPLILSILVMLMCSVFLFLYIKNKPKIIILDSTYAALLIGQSMFTMLIYCYMQYRWVVLQFEQNKWLEILWAGNETLLLFTIFWSVMLSSLSILKNRENLK